jgi:ferrochelatase
LAEVERVAVVLFNLGGPDGLDAVQPFLFNLFKDPAIIAAPNPLRWLIAKLISRRRAPIAREIYSHLGGASPILGETRAQAEALEAILTAQQSAIQWQVEIAMRYWHPFAATAAARLKPFGAQRIVLLPLYPQYSGTTTGSSLKDWNRAASAQGLDADQALVCCYPDHPAFVAAQVAYIVDAIKSVRRDTGDGKPLHILLSAHGLPKRVIDRGDPYQWQVERTTAAIARGLEARGLLEPETEIVTCYQSRVGPLEWIGPATDAEIKRAGAAGAAVVVVPIAFVSEHSETLVELDIEYADLARACGVTSYTRVPALATNDSFIACLAELVMETLGPRDAPARVHTGMADPEACERAFSTCPRCGQGTA